MNSKNVLKKIINNGPMGQPILFPKKVLRLHSMITSVGYEIRQQASEYNYDGLRRGRAEFVLFQYTISGCGRLEYEGKVFKVTPGQAMILHIPHNHRYWLEQGERWEFFYICLNGKEILRIWREALREIGPIINLPYDTVLFQKAAQIVYQASLGSLKDSFATSAISYDLGMELLAYITHAQVESMEADSYERQIQNAVEFCRQNLANDIGVADLAAAAGLSRFYFSKLFKMSQKMSPGKFIAYQRIRLAIKLLQTTEDSIDEIAKSSGFADSNYFCKVFKKEVGCTPGEFRKSGMFIN